MNETADEKTSDELQDSVIPIVIILVIQSLGTIIGNVFVCIAIYIRPNLHNVTYYSIFSLAIADLLAGIVAMPSYIAKKFVYSGPYVTFICDSFRFSYFITGYASILSLCVISVDRLIAVKNPLAYVNIVTRKRVVFALVLIWIDCVVVSLLPFIPLPGKQTYECNYNPTRWWSVMVIVTNVLIPFLFIVICYMYIYCIARTHLQRIKSERKSVRGSLVTDSNDKRKQRKQRKESKANVTIMIVIGLFIVCWFPSSIYYFLQMVCPHCFPESFTGSTRDLVNALVKLLTFTSSLSNPIIYCWRSVEFRRAFIKIVTRKTINFAESLRSRSSTSNSAKLSLAQQSNGKEKVKEQAV